jgi:hypothetical protein
MPLCTTQCSTAQLKITTSISQSCALPYSLPLSAPHAPRSLVQYLCPPLPQHLCVKVHSSQAVGLGHEDVVVRARHDERRSNAFATHHRDVQQRAAGGGLHHDEVLVYAYATRGFKKQGLRLLVTVLTVTRCCTKHTVMYYLPAR